jgi:hypothetical protein
MKSLTTKAHTYTHKEYIKRVLQRWPEDKLKERMCWIEMFVDLDRGRTTIAALAR